MGERSQNETGLSEAGRVASEGVAIPQETVLNILVLARLRKNPITWPEMDRVIDRDPQLASVRAVAFFPFLLEESLLEIGSDMYTWHSDLHREVRERGIENTQMVSGEFFEIDGRKFLKFDREPQKFLSNEDFQGLTSSGYIILTPEFTLYSPEIK